MEIKGNKFQGYVERYLYRDEMTGRGRFLFKTQKQPYQKTVVRSEVIANDNGQEEEWFTIIVDAFEIPVPYYEARTPIEITGIVKDLTGVENYGKYPYKLLAVQELTGCRYLTYSYLVSMKTDKDIADAITDACRTDDGYDVFTFMQKPEAVRKLTVITHNCKRPLTVSDAKALQDIVSRTSLERSLYQWLGPMEIPYDRCSKAIKLFGDHAKETLSTHPYDSGKLLNLSLVQCDRIARSAGIAFDAIERCKAVSEATNEKIGGNGSVFLSANLYSKSFRRVSVQSGAYTERVLLISSALAGGEQIGYNQIDDKNHIFNLPLMQAETRIADNMIRLCFASKRMQNNNKVLAAMSHAEEHAGVTYGLQQSQAFQLFLSYKGGINILCGGPGTGKTSTANGIIQGFLELYPGSKVALAAPTGRAAQRLSESTGREATTVHRLLNYVPYGNQSASCRNESNPIDADLILIDEMSMMDTELFDMLLNATKTGTTLILMGDTNQLEAVGPGCVLRDIMKSGLPIRKMTLSEVFRQKGGSPVIENATRIQQGNSSMEVNDDFQILDVKTPEEALDKVLGLSKYYWNPNDPFETQILCPSRKGKAGLYSINKEVQGLLNSKGKEGFRYGAVRYRVGDKIMMIRNNYEKDYYNGDLGTLKRFEDGIAIVEINGKEIRITHDIVNDMTLSYGMTIHKSQGSEFRNVIVVVPEEPSNMLVRNLFYTAMTRAKKRVIVINQNGAMTKAIETVKGKSRNTYLPYALRDRVSRNQERVDIFSEDIEERKKELGII